MKPHTSKRRRDREIVKRIEAILPKYRQIPAQCECCGDATGSLTVLADDARQVQPVVCHACSVRAFVRGLEPFVEQHHGKDAA